MSDPVANVDIEDVLSSIRRLVSNGPERGGAPSAAVHEADRLVLTPSQRVDGADIAEDADDPAPVASAGVTDAHPPEGGAPELYPPETDIETAEDVADGATEMETDPLACADVDSPDEAGAAPDAGTKADNDPELDGIAAMFARHEPATPTAWEPDGDDEDAFADEAEAPVLDWRDADADDETGEDAAPQDTPDRATAQAQDWGTNAPDDDENAFAIEDEAVLDEEALRDLVAEIVREELMGTLGERITRNVRKLVRREIHRALNSQDFD